MELVLNHENLILVGMQVHSAVASISRVCVYILRQMEVNE